MSTTRALKALPITFIPATAANERIKNFNQYKRPVLDAAMNGEETKSIWYSRGHLEEIMKELYYLNADGVRIYFGAYDSHHQKYPGQMCLVFVPTYLNETNNKHKDIVIEQEPGYEERPQSEPYTDEESIKNFNFGSLCKPDCDGQEFAFPDNF